MWVSWVLMIVLLLAPGTAPAQTLTALETTLTQTESQLRNLQTHIATQKAAHTQAAQQAQALTYALLRMKQVPMPVWVINQLLNPAHVADSRFFALTAQQSSAQIATLHARNQSLFTLYERAQNQLAKLNTLHTQMAQYEGRKGRLQRAQLAAAGVAAGQLAQKLAMALNSPTVSPPPLTDTWADIPLFAPPTPSAVPRTERVIAAQPSSTVAAATSAPPPSGATLAPPPLSGTPLARPMVGKVLQRFREGSGATAEGVVLGAKPGTPVATRMGGDVLFAGDFRQFGGVVIIKSATDGHDELMGGLGTLTVQAGQKVAPGQSVGTLGAQGRLYWEVHHRGQARNPLTTSAR